MWHQVILELLTKLIAACIVMIVHEYVKTKTYEIVNKNSLNKKLKNYSNILSYIDPIGLLLYVFCNAGFSKPSIFFLRDKKTSITLGRCGLLTYLIMFFLFCAVGQTKANIDFPNELVNYFFNGLAYYLALFSISGFFLNLFPLSSFDMGLLMAGKSVDNFIKLLKIDFIVKATIVICISVGFIYQLSYIITNIFIIF